MAELKTKKNNGSVEQFLKTVSHEGKRKDAFDILEMMKEITGEQPKMWGTSIIGFGDIHYKYASGREGDWFRCGFSPRKQSISFYLMGCDISQAEDLLKQLGKHRTGKGCLYINKLVDVDKNILKKLIRKSYQDGKIGV